MNFLIQIFGIIGWDIFAEDVVAQIEQADGDIDVEIGSIGGSVYEGVLIFNAFNAYDKGKVNIIVKGEIMSIATYIAMAGDSIKVHDNTVFMIHNAWSGIDGDHNKMRKQADHLEAVSEIMAKKYAERSGKTVEEIKQLMDAETYFYGQEIVDNGFADEIISTQNDTSKVAALKKVKEDFASLNAKLSDKACDDADKTCELLNIKGLMKQYENKPFNLVEEDKMDELMKRLKALEAKAQRSDDENSELAKLRIQIDAKKDEELKALKQEKADLQRVNEVNALAAKYGVFGSETHTKFQKEGSASDFVVAILDSQMSKPLNQREDQPENRAEMLMAMADGLAMRQGAAVKNPHAKAADYQHASLLAIARSISGAGDYASPYEVAHSVLSMGSSDFPILLANVANKILMSAWEEEPTTYQEWCSEGDVNDFKENTFVHLGGFGNLKDLKELGELKKAGIKESKETGKIGSKGLTITLSREAIINDDLGGFTRMIQSLVQSARRTLNADVYGVLTGSTYKTNDGVALFHSTHKNLASSGTAITDASLTAGELAMGTQKGLNDENLNISPYFMITGPKKYREGKQVLSSTSVPGTDNNSGTVNTWAGELTQIKDGNITGNDWYLAAKNGSVKVLFLAGTGRKPIVEETSRSLSGVTFTVVYDYGVMVENHRTLYKNPGA